MQLKAPLSIGKDRENDAFAAIEQIQEELRQLKAHVVANNASVAIAAPASVVAQEADGAVSLARDPETITDSASAAVPSEAATVPEFESRPVSRSSQRRTSAVEAARNSITSIGWPSATAAATLLFSTDEPTAEAVQADPAIPPPRTSERVFVSAGVRREEASEITPTVVATPEVSAESTAGTLIAGAWESEDMDFTRSEDTSVTDLVASLPTLAFSKDGRDEQLQGLLHDVYDKICVCSDRLKEQRTVNKGGSYPAVCEAQQFCTEAPETLEEIEWLRRSLVHMHQHLLSAQERTRTLEKQCQDYEQHMQRLQLQPETVQNGEVYMSAGTVTPRGAPTPEPCNSPWKTGSPCEEVDFQQIVTISPAASVAAPSSARALLATSATSSRANVMAAGTLTPSMPGAMPPPGVPSRMVSAPALTVVRSVVAPPRELSPAPRAVAVQRELSPTPLVPSRTPSELSPTPRPRVPVQRHAAVAVRTLLVPPQDGRSIAATSSAAAPSPAPAVRMVSSPMGLPQQQRPANAGVATLLQSLPRGSGGTISPAPSVHRGGASTPGLGPPIPRSAGYAPSPKYSFEVPTLQRTAINL